MVLTSSEPGESFLNQNNKSYYVLFSEEDERRRTIGNESYLQMGQMNYHLLNLQAS